MVVMERLRIIEELQEGFQRLCGDCSCVEPYYSSSSLQCIVIILIVIIIIVIIIIMVTQHIPTSQIPTRWESDIMMKGGNMTQSNSHHTHIYVTLSKDQRDWQSFP